MPGMTGNSINEWIVNRLSRFPPQYDRLFTVIETLQRHAAKVFECIAMATNQGKEIPRQGEIDIVTP